MPKIDILTAMKARRQITVDQYRAARRWQALQAQADDIVLARCAHELGHDGNTLLCAVLGDKKILDRGGGCARHGPPLRPGICQSAVRGMPADVGGGIRAAGPPAQAPRKRAHAADGGRGRKRTSGLPIDTPGGLGG